MDSLLVELQSQIDLGDTLVENCRNILSHVSGISKFESRINAELKFLKPLLKKTSKLKEKGFQKRLGRSTIPTLESNGKHAIACIYFSCFYL